MNNEILKGLLEVSCCPYHDGLCAEIYDYVINLQQENQQLKKQKDDGIKYIKEHIKYECDDAFNGMQFYSYHLYNFDKKELLRMLGEIDD